MIGFGQILIVLLIVLLLFGNLPKLLKDLAQGIKLFQKTLQEKETEKPSKQIESENESSKKHSS